jgi:hypothetical protein
LRELRAWRGRLAELLGCTAHTGTESGASKAEAHRGGGP